MPKEQTARWKKTQKSILKKLNDAKKNFDPKLAKKALKYGIKKSVNQVGFAIVGSRVKLAKGAGTLAKETLKRKAPKVYKKVKDTVTPVVTKATSKLKSGLEKTKKWNADRKAKKALNKKVKEAKNLKTQKKVEKLRKETGLNPKPFNRKKYDGKDMSPRAKILTQIGVGLGVTEFVRQTLKTNKFPQGNKTYTPDSGKDNYGTVNPKTTGRKSEMTSPYTNKKTTKNPKITYNKPVAGKDFPDYNNSTGGNYGHQASGTQKDDLVYEHASQTQMNKARSSMGQGKWNFTSKKPKKQGY